LLAAETAKVAMEARPRLATAGEQTQAMHFNFERIAIGIASGGIRLPGAEHARPPYRPPMRCELRQVVINHRPLDEVDALRMGIEIGDEPPNRVRCDQHVTVDAEDKIATGLADDALPARRALAFGQREVTVVRNHVLQAFERFSA